MTLHILGNAAVDAFYEVPDLPRPGETLLARRETYDLGGKGLNQAVMAARTGATVAFWSAVGDDPHGADITARLQTENIDSHVTVRTGATDRSIIFVAASGENSIVSTAGQVHAIDRTYADRMLDAMAPGDALLLQGNLVHDITKHALNQAKATGVRTLINPAPIDFAYHDVLPAADVVIVNEIENLTLSGQNNAADGAAALVSHGMTTVVTTLGAAGVLLTTADGTQTFTAPQVATVDTTGAGDVFCGVFAGALTLGMTPTDACGWSVRAAAQAVTRHGTMAAFPDATEVAACRQP